MHQPDVEPVTERRHHLVRFALPQQAVIDEDAGQLVADRLMDQHRRDRRIHAAGQPADHPPRARPARGSGRSRVARNPAIVHAPGQAGDAMREIAQQLRAMRRVRDLRMELQAVELPRIVGDHRERRALATRHRAEPRRQARHAVAVAHPHLLARAVLPHAVGTARNRRSRRRRRGRIRGGRTAATSPPSCGAQQLFAVADAQDRHAEFEHRLRRAAARQPHAREAGPPDRMTPRGLQARDAGRIGVERPDLAIDAGFAKRGGR